MKKNSRFYIHRLKENMIKNVAAGIIKKPNRLFFKCIGPLSVLVLPAMVVFILSLYIGLAGKYLANEKVAKEVVVNHAECVTSRYKKYIELDVTDANQKRYTVEHGVDTCKNLNNVARLDKQAVELVGRQWYLGFYYEELHYPGDIDFS